MKFITFAKAPSGQDYKEFQRWFSQEYVAAVRKSSPTLCGCVLRRRIEPPINSVFDQYKDVHQADLTPFDVAFETWFPAPDDYRREVLRIEDGLRELNSQYVTYSVSPKLHRDPRVAEAGENGRRPEATFIFLIKWPAGSQPEAAEKDWLDHAAVALRTQPDLTKYEQNGVRDVISWSPGVSHASGYADCSVRTIKDLAAFAPTEEEIQDSTFFAGAVYGACLGDAETF
jgi:hypothetical protein